MQEFQNPYACTFLLPLIYSVLERFGQGRFGESVPFSGVTEKVSSMHAYTHLATYLYTC